MLLRYPTRLRPSIIAMSPFSPCPPFPLQERPHTQGWTTSRITHADSIFMGWGAPGGHDSSFARFSWSGSHLPAGSTHGAGRGLDRPARGITPQMIRERAGPVASIFSDSRKWGVERSGPRVEADSRGS